MTASNGVVSADKFKSAFNDISALIREEWPEVEEAELADTGGELDDVVTLVAAKTEHSKVLVKRHLGELAQVAGSGGHRTIERLRGALEDIEGRTKRIVEYARSDLAHDAGEKVRENVWVSLLVALGFGFLVGMLVRGGRGR